MSPSDNQQPTWASDSIWALLTAVSGVDDEYERARLTATGLPSLIPCNLSGVILASADGTRSKTPIQLNGDLLPEVEAKRLVRELHPVTQTALQRPEPTISIVDDATPSGSLPSALTRLGVRQLAMTPMMTLRSKLGVLLVGRGDSTVFTSYEKTALLRLAEHLAVGLENLCLSKNLHRLVDERTDRLRQAEEQWRVLLEINNAVVSNLDRESLFAAITLALRRVISFDRASVAIYDPQRDVFVMYVLVGASETTTVPLGASYRRHEAPFHAVTDSGHPRLMSDLRATRRDGVLDALVREGLQSAVITPLRGKDRVLGTLNVASLTPNQYSETDAILLSDVGSQIAVAIENMLTYEEMATLKTRLEQENVYLQEEIKTQHDFEEIVGTSPAIKAALQAVATVAPTNAAVLITGETGTGKELIARAVHNLSKRKEQPLIRVNCASIPRDLFESEFFGHVRGAFTGAIDDRLGRFQLADGGTLFLDEVAEIPLELQGKLLRVLQEGEFERIGDAKTRSVDVRVIAATNRDLDGEIEAGRFRKDLYFRLSVFPLTVAPLRERLEDIPLLASHFLRKACRKLGIPDMRFEPQHVQVLQSYYWPGNVRELQNVVERAAITSRAGALEFDVRVADSDRTVDTAGPRPDFASSLPLTYADLERMERENLKAALAQTKWKIWGPGGAAELLRINPSTLTSRIRAMGLRRPR